MSYPTRTYHGNRGCDQPCSVSTGHPLGGCILLMGRSCAGTPFTTCCDNSLQLGLCGTCEGFCRCPLLCGIAQDAKSILDYLSGICRLGLVDSQPTPEICSLEKSFGLECITGTKNLRCSIEGWKHDKEHLRHCEVGDVTTTSTHEV